MNICFFDFETTGLDVKNANILEAAFVDFLSGKTINHSYILPYDVETIENSNIHNITFESLKLNNAITFENFIENIFNLLKDFYNNKNTIYLIAHNNFNYDQLVLEYNMKKINKNIEDSFKFCDSLLHLCTFKTPI